MKSRLGWSVIGFALWLAGTMVVMAQEVSEEARRYMLRGQVALEMAKSPQDLRLAIRELEQAARLAPDWPDIHFNLGMVRAKAGDLGGAIASYNRYLQLAPDAVDAQKVRDEVIKLEFRQEQTVVRQSMSGTWVGSGGSYAMQMTDGKLTLSNNAKAINDTDAEEIFVPLVGRMTMPVGAQAAFSMRAEVSGSLMRGDWRRGEYKLGDCVIPADSGSFEGEISLDGTRMTAQLTKRRYRAVYGVSVMGYPCHEVTELEPVQEKLVLYGPLGEGKIGVNVYYPNDTDFSPGASKNHTLYPVKGGPAAQAGIVEGTHLLMIDGISVPTLDPGEVQYRLTGPAGSIVRLTVLPPKGTAPVELAVTRVAPVKGAQGASATSSGCFIATAAYGSPFEEHVATLRDFRDRHLLTNAPGRWFVEQYYEHSPPVADYISEREGLRAAVRGVLTPVVYAVRSPWLTLAGVFALLAAAIGWRRRRALIGKAV